MNNATQYEEITAWLNAEIAAESRPEDVTGALVAGIVASIECLPEEDRRQYVQAVLGAMARMFPGECGGLN